MVILHGCGHCPHSWNCSPVTAVGIEELILGLGSLPLLYAGHCRQGHRLVSFQKLRLLVVNAWHGLKIRVWIRKKTPNVLFMQNSLGLAITVGPEIESLNLGIKAECVCWIMNGQAATPAWLGSAEIYSLLVTGQGAALCLGQQHFHCAGWKALGFSGCWRLLSVVPSDLYGRFPSNAIFYEEWRKNLISWFICPVMKIHVPTTLLAAFATQASVIVSQKRLGQKLAFLNAVPCSLNPFHDSYLVCSLRRKVADRGPV